MEASLLPQASHGCLVDNMAGGSEWLQNEATPNAYEDAVSSSGI